MSSLCKMKNKIIKKRKQEIWEILRISNLKIILKEKIGMHPFQRKQKVNLKSWLSFYQNYNLTSNENIMSLFWIM